MAKRKRLSPEAKAERDHEIARLWFDDRTDRNTLPARFGLARSTLEQIAWKNRPGHIRTFAEMEADAGRKPAYDPWRDAPRKRR